MRKKPFGRLCLMLCLMLSLVCAACASAEQANHTAEIELSMGFNDTVTYLRNIPVIVTVTNNGADADGLVQVEVERSSMVYDMYEAPLAVANGATACVTIPVELTFKQDEYTVRWTANGSVLAEKRIKPVTTLDPSALIIGVLSDNGRSLSQFDITQTADPLMRMEYWRTVPVGTSELPDSLDGMQFFDMLMIDGADLSALNVSQQAALERWLNEGGIIIVGGGAQAATGFPYFAKFSGITAGALIAADNISAELIEILKSGEEPMSGLSRISELKGASGLSIGGDTRLIDIAKVGGGKLITCAFSLSDEPLAKWQGRFALWQRVLIGYESAAYSRMVGMRNTNSRYNYIGNNYVDNGITASIEIPNLPGSELPVVLLAAFVLLVGFGGYLLLKRFDKREWMWAYVPALALGVSLVMWALSGSIGITKPAAAYYTIVRMDKDGAVDTFTGAVAARANSGRVRLSADEGTIDPSPGISYFDSGYAEPEAQNKKELRYTYRFGDEQSVEMPSTITWEQVSFAIDNVPIRDCVLSGECSLDGEGLLFTVRNEGGVSLEPGVIMTDYGYVSVGALAPGEVLTARLLPHADPNASLNNTYDMDGVLLSDADRSRYSFYDYVHAYNTSSQKKNKYNDRKLSLHSSMLNYAMSMRSQSMNAENMRYYAFSNELCPVDLRVDGELVTRSSHYDMIELALKYNPVGADGSVKFLKGGFPVFEANVDKQDVPSLGAGITDIYRYYRLENKPAFGFDTTSIPEGFKLKSFRLYASYAYYSHKLCLYNTVTGTWDEAVNWVYDPAVGKGEEKSSVTSLDGYINEDGILYARFEKLANTDDYAEIGAPVLTMEGRID